MRRYAFEPDQIISETLTYDVCIIGIGLAGLYTAINLSPRLSCIVLGKDGLEKSNSWLAQGGIAAAISKDDRPKFHYSDTLVAGAGLCNHAAVRVLVDEGPSDIETLVSLNVPFDLDEDGDLSITREGGHNRNRIVHCGGDSTGKETVKVLASVADSRANITLCGNTFLVDILLDQMGHVAGALIFDGVYKLIKTGHIVICTGGIGGVYAHSTNPSSATGDGIAAALRAGAKIEKMEFIQFHPTGLYEKGSKGRTFLISEAVRGEGGILRNKFGVAFMKDLHPLADLAPRDIVARAIIKEIAKTDSGYVSLDITHRDQGYLKKRFPTIFEECLKRGLDLSKDFIPVCPVQHYMIGGIKTDLNGHTNISGLYACGESASTGVHGANRLASNSMLECLVFGRRCAVHISTATGTRVLGSPPLFPKADRRKKSAYEDVHETRLHMQRIMNVKGNVIRRQKDLATGLAEIRELKAKLKNSSLITKEAIETFNMVLVCEKILSAAKRRKKSIGAHYRED